jgi:SHS2 domain-containing protein
MPEWLEQIDHTGDVGIVVRGANLEELFARAAWGMFAVITDMAVVEPRDTTAIEVAATDRAALLQRWLSELNFRHATGYRLFCRFKIRELSDERLAADAMGEPIDPDRHSIFAEIKAVTFHELSVEQVGGHWQARIIFDI